MTRRPRAALRHVMRCMACCMRALLDLGKGRALWRPSSRCARAQGSGGGLLSMAKGTALFDAVAISDTHAECVLEGTKVRVGPDAHMGRVSADGVRGRLQWAWLPRLCAEVRRRRD